MFLSQNIAKSQGPRNDFLLEGAMGKVGDELRWGSSGFAEQLNLKKICHGIRNSSNSSAERRNSPPLPDADFLENDKRNAEFSGNFMDLRILHLSVVL